MSAAAATRPYDLPEPLPAGEEVLWQGRPEWRALALRAFHVRKIAIYFSILALWRAVSALIDGASVLSTATSVLWLITLGCAAVGVLMLMAWLSARSTLYTVTTRRILMQFGVALPMTLNIPFRVIGSAAVKTYPDGTGEIPIMITGAERIAYLVLWPYARPWRAARAEPMLRAVPDARHVADIFARALVAASAAALPATQESLARPAAIHVSTPVRRAVAAA
jgi:Bacterial PH domain